jgi:hypothetical protein
MCMLAVKIIFYTCTYGAREFHKKIFEAHDTKALKIGPVLMADATKSQP